MKRTHTLWRLATLAVAVIAASPWSFAHAEKTEPSLTTPAPATTAAKPRVEVCFVLDTTGSMGGLIEGAKQKIWSIANEIAAAKPSPELKLGLVAFRDRGDEYVVKSWPLSDDIDAIYGHLRELKADGGGDTPESVNEALAEAVHKMAWSQDRQVLKLIFLVGDAPPHMDYADGPKYPEVCQEAVRRDLIINAVQCGSAGDTMRVWQEIAQLGEGSFAAIAQSGGVVVVEAPQDKRLAELNREIGATLIPYGSATVQSEVRRKQAAAVAAAPAAAADRLSFNAKTGRTVQGSGELLDELAAGKADLEKIERKDLPADLQKMERDELKAEIERRREQRGKLQAEIARLSQERETFLREENQHLARKGGGDAFDTTVAQTLRRQAARKGIRYE